MLNYALYFKRILPLSIASYSSGRNDTGVAVKVKFVRKSCRSAVLGMSTQSKSGGGASSSWVQRTRSGLPLCPDCGVEYGFCEHSPMKFGQSSKTRRGSVSIAAKSAAAVSAGRHAAVLAAAEAGSVEHQNRGIKRPHEGGSQGRGSVKGRRPGKGHSKVRGLNSYWKGLTGMKMHLCSALPGAVDVCCTIIVAR